MACLVPGVMPAVGSDRNARVRGSWAVEGDGERFLKVGSRYPSVKRNTGYRWRPGELGDGLVDPIDSQGLIGQELEKKKARHSKRRAKFHDEPSHRNWARCSL
jgi:hypothetical protein